MMRKHLLLAVVLLAAGLVHPPPLFSQVQPRDPEWREHQHHVLLTGGVRVGASMTGPLIDDSGTSVRVPSLVVTGAVQTADGVGAKNGSAVTVVELGTAAVHKTVFTLTALVITMTDAGAAGSHGTHKLYDFPAGVIIRGGCVANVTTLAGAGGIADGAAAVFALGQSPTGTDNATLLTTEADFIASFAGTLTAGAGIFAKYGEPSVTSIDGHTTPTDLYLNTAVPDADSSASDTLTITGTITCIWSSSGDF